MSTATSTGSTGRPLPLLRRIGLRHLSLYQNRRDISIELGDGVFCLAGANGLGKSTFLATVNFGLTGVVADPDRKFKSVREYYQDSLAYSSSYFDGRVDELDRDTAEVSLEFEVGPHTYQLTRNLFEPLALRSLSITNGDGLEVMSSVDDEDQARHAAYASQIVADMRLANFDQLVFLQHFVLTFDERRHLIFFDRVVTEQALYLAFNIDPADVELADELRRQVDRTESQARNLQYQSTVARNRLRDLQQRAAPDSQGTSTLLAEHVTLLDSRDASHESAIDAKGRAADARIESASAASAWQLAESDYGIAFAQRLSQRHAPRLHPVVASTLSSRTCEICGTAGEKVVHAVEARLAANHCPLCDSQLAPPNAPHGSFDELVSIDKRMVATRDHLSAAQAQANRLIALAEQAEDAADDAQRRLNDFEDANRELSAPTGTSALAEIARSLEAERADAMARRDEYRRSRDAARVRLRPIQEALASAYENGELDFVPTFTGLARQFLGLDLDIHLVRRDAAGSELVLEVESTRRRTTTQLSESQRFFLDIALRMALASYMTGPNGHAVLFLDTPEGSLDIAYGGRAGVMIGDFVAGGHQVLMTANINTSQLLRRLARACGRDHMTLVRMTEWAPLSEVQAEAEDLFDAAFSAIEAEQGAGSEDSRPQ